MPRSLVFATALAIAACSSLGVLALRIGGESAVAAPSSPEGSAQISVPATVANTIPTVVTEATPTSTPEHTETPAPEAATAVPTVEVSPPTPAVTSPPRVNALPAAVEVEPAPGLSGERADDLFARMNAAREAAGLSPLAWDDRLAEVAVTRAHSLVELDYFDHYGPDGGSAFSELAARDIRYRLAGENLARNNYPEARTVQAAFEGLMASPGHRANILEPQYARVGVAALKSGRMWVYVTVFMD